MWVYGIIEYDMDLPYKQHESYLIQESYLLQIAAKLHNFGHYW